MVSSPSRYGNLNYGLITDLDEFDLERLKIVVQQSHNAEELKEQTSLLQELRKEIDKLRNEQEKIKDNERRDRDEKGNGEKIEPYVRAGARRHGLCRRLWVRR